MTFTLVTGASGFVGTCLMEELHRRAHPYIGVSQTYREGLVRIPTYTTEMNWDPLLDGVEVIVHLAARVHVMNDRSSEPLREFRQSNVEASLHLARSAARCGVRRFVFVSTIKVNGERTELGCPFKADASPNPEGPYAISKMEAEKALLELARDTGLEIVIIRPTLVYGPGVKGNIATLAKWGKLGLPSPLGLIQNRRSLLHVSNLCDLLMIASEHPNAANQVFLAADGNSVSTEQILQELGWTKAPRWLCKLASSILKSRLFENNAALEKIIGNLEADIGDTTEKLGWKPNKYALQNMNEYLLKYRTEHQ